jgi:SIR2-like domain
VIGLERAIDGARQGRLAVVAGAGISMLPPSNLPSWWEFTAALLTAALAKAATAPFLDEDSIAAVRSLTPDSINTATLSEAISKYVASIAYFPVLTVLDGTTINANHQALAELARLGRLRAIVTPNFDTLIERAFQEGRVPLADPATDTETGKACTLIRLHGVATAAQSMIDTVAQKARGLPFDTHEALRERLRDCRVMVVGFSGLDLDFAWDYLSLRRRPSKA